MSDTVLIQINYIDENVSLDWLSIATRMDERLDSHNIVTQDGVGSRDEIDNGLFRNIPPTSNIIHDEYKNVVDSEVGDDVIYGKPLYLVRWYGHSAADNISKPTKHILSHFITRFRKRRK